MRRGDRVVFIPDGRAGVVIRTKYEFSFVDFDGEYFYNSSLRKVPADFSNIEELFT